MGSQMSSHSRRSERRQDQTVQSSQTHTPRTRGYDRSGPSFSGRRPPSCSSAATVLTCCPLLGISAIRRRINVQSLCLAMVTRYVAAQIGLPVSVRWMGRQACVTARPASTFASTTYAIRCVFRVGESMYVTMAEPNGTAQFAGILFAGEWPARQREPDPGRWRKTERPAK